MANHTPDLPPASDPASETVESMIEDVTSEVAPILDYAMQTAQRLAAQFFSQEGLYQVGVITLAFAVSLMVVRPARQLVSRIWPRTDSERVFMSNALTVVRGLVVPILTVIFLWIGLSALRRIGIGSDLVRIVASLLQAWILIRLFSTFVRDPFWSRAFAFVAWTLAALNILRLLNPLIAILDGMAINLGEARLSLFLIIKGITLLVLLIWFASLVSRFVQSRLGRSQNLTPSVKSLINQAVRIALFFAAVMIAMNIVGIDLTALAVFSGALGVGIGFGLQAIFSNLVSGIIMLLEGSIKVGDFVELESGLNGEVREINTRATLVTTNDNIDILVPNSEFINSRVTNWTLRDSFRRLRIPFGVAYGTDKELVMKAALEAAEATPHMLTGRNAKPPQVWLMNFGESSLDFELVVWLKPEAVKRPNSVLADYNWQLETALSKYGIEIPFPQRDLHIRSGSLPINLTAETRKKEPAQG